MFPESSHSGSVQKLPKGPTASHPQQIARSNLSLEECGELEWSSLDAMESEWYAAGCGNNSSVFDTVSRKVWCPTVPVTT